MRYHSMSLIIVEYKEKNVIILKYLKKAFEVSNKKTPKVWRRRKKEKKK